MIEAQKGSSGFRDRVGNLEEFVKNNPELDERKEYENMGIFSLSEDPKNIQMWSYYADSHKGICIEFDTKKLSPDPKKFLVVPVEYSSDFAEVDLYAQVEDMPKKIAYKHKGWEHEKEWRIPGFQRNGKISNGLRPCNCQSISSIILGIEAAKDIDTLGMVRGWIQEVKEKDNHTIKLKQAIAIPYKFEIEIVDFPI